MIAEWLSQLSAAKRIDYKKNANEIKFYPAKVKSYKPVRIDSVEAEYDKFIGTNKTKSDWEKVNSTLKLVYETANCGGYETETDTTYLTGKSKHIAYMTNKLSGQCNEYATYTASVLKDLGLLAGILGFSSKDSLGNFLGLHTVAGVIVENRLYLLDPLFCTYYVNKLTKEPIDFVSLINFLKERKNDQISALAINHGAGHGLSINKLGCTPDSSIVLYKIDGDLYKGDDEPDVSFANSNNFILKIENILKRKGYLIDYFSFFAFLNYAEGSNEFVTKVKDSFSQISRRECTVFKGNREWNLQFESNDKIETIDTCCTKLYRSLLVIAKDRMNGLDSTKKQQIQNQFDALNYSRINFKKYSHIDSTTAVAQYDKFIAKSSNLKEWDKIEQVLRLVYETANRGNFNIGMNKNLSSGKDKYVAFATDKMSGQEWEYASFTAAVLNDLGIVSGTLKLAATDSTGYYLYLHTLPAVILNSKVYALDPMLCTYYIDPKTNEPLELKEVKQLIKQQLNSVVGRKLIKHSFGHSIVPYTSDCTINPSTNWYKINSSLVKNDDYLDESFSNSLYFKPIVKKTLHYFGLNSDYISFLNFYYYSEGNMDFLMQLKPLMKNY